MDQQTPAVQQPIHLQLAIPEAALPLLTDVQKGWLKFAVLKGNTFKELQNFELKAQGILAPIIKEGATPTLDEVQKALKECKAIFNEAEACRKHMTGMFQERVIGPSMDFEKRIKESLVPVEATELALRIKANEKANEEAAYNREVAAFKAHITNQYYEQATAYRLALNQEIMSTYLGCLEASISSENIPEYIAKLKETLPTIARIPFVKYQRVLLKDPEATKIFSEIPKWDYTVDLKSALLKVDETFSMYSNDLMNAEAAMTSIQEQAEKDREEALENLEAEVSTNNLIASATPLTMTGGPKVKTTLAILVEEGQPWEMNVIKSFLKHWQKARPYIKSASEKLSVGQMATALGKLATETQGLLFDGLTLIEKKK